MATTRSKTAAPKYAIGTHFRKKFLGYGIWEGVISSFDGDDYEVRYLEDNYIEFISIKDMDDIVTRSNKYVQNKVKLETLQSHHQQQVGQKIPSNDKRCRLPTERYPPAPWIIKQEQQRTDTTSSFATKKPSFKEGQHVWVCAGREMHSARIIEICSSSKVKIQWSTMQTYSFVSMDDIKPMFDSNTNGEIIASHFSRRTRERTERFSPPLPTKQEQEHAATTTNNGLKKQPSRTKRTKKTATKRSFSKKQRTFVKRESIQSGVSSQKTESVSLQELFHEKEKEDDYKSLWNTYLEPQIRKNVELPYNGMRIRQTKAMCGLLRCKTSTFRKKLYKRIINLDKEGKKDEIYQMLKQMREHDESGAVDEGPKELMEEILKISQIHDDEVAVVDCVKQEQICMNIEVGEPKAGTTSKSAFEPIHSANASGEREEEAASDLADSQSTELSRYNYDLSATTERAGKVGNHRRDSTAAQAKQGICSPCSDNSMDECPKRFKSAESNDSSTISSLTFPGAESRSPTPQIPAEITIKRRFDSLRTKGNDAKISSTVCVTPPTVETNGQNLSQAMNSEKNETNRTTTECIDLCEDMSDGNISEKQIGIIDVDTESHQDNRKKSTSTNGDVILLD